MARLGGERGVGAALDEQTLRIAGLAAVVCSTAVTAASLGTSHGLATAGQSATSPLTVVVDIGVPAAFVEFAAAHPAYPAVALIGLVLVAAGEDTPLVGS